MISEQRRLEIQAQAVRGFSTWLRSSPPNETDEGREFNEELIHVFEIYAGELRRLIDGTSASQDWLNIVAVTSLLASMLRDEFLEINPELAEYRMTDEPQSVDEMVARLLADALRLFAQCGRPEALASIGALVQRVRSQ